MTTICAAAAIFVTATVAVVWLYRSYFVLKGKQPIELKCEGLPDSGRSVVLSQANVAHSSRSGKQSPSERSAPSNTAKASTPSNSVRDRRLKEFVTKDVDIEVSQTHADQVMAWLLESDSNTVFESSGTPKNGLDVAAVQLSGERPEAAFDQLADTTPEFPAAVRLQNLSPGWEGTFTAVGHEAIVEDDIPVTVSQPHPSVLGPASIFETRVQTQIDGTKAGPLVNDTNVLNEAMPIDGLTISTSAEVGLSLTGEQDVRESTFQNASFGTEELLDAELNALQTEEPDGVHANQDDRSSPPDSDLATLSVAQEFLDEPEAAFDQLADTTPEFPAAVRLQNLSPGWEGTFTAVGHEAIVEDDIPVTVSQPHPSVLGPASIFETRVQTQIDGTQAGPLVNDTNVLNEAMPIDGLTISTSAEVGLSLTGEQDVRESTFQNASFGTEELLDAELNALQTEEPDGVHANQDDRSSPPDSDLATLSVAQEFLDEPEAAFDQLADTTPEFPAAVRLQNLSPGWEGTFTAVGHEAIVEDDIPVTVSQPHPSVLGPASIFETRVQTQIDGTQAGPLVNDTNVLNEAMPIDGLTISTSAEVGLSLTGEQDVRESTFQNASFGTEELLDAELNALQTEEPDGVHANQDDRSSPPDSDLATLSVAQEFLDEPEAAFDGEVANPKTRSAPRYQPTARTPKTTRRRDRRKNVDRADANDAAIRTRKQVSVRVILGLRNQIRISLLPARGSSMAESVHVYGPDGDQVWNALQDEWFADIVPANVATLLLDGAIWTSRESNGEIEWSFSGREICVLSKNATVSGYVSVPRLLLGEDHLVLCAESKLDVVRKALKEAGCEQPSPINGNGVPEGWNLFVGVRPREAVAHDQNDGILNILRPLDEVEIDLRYGIRLTRSKWLYGHPPKIRMRGSVSRTADLFIDEKLAVCDESGNFTVQGWDDVGMHTVYCGGQTVGYELLHGLQEWERFDSFKYQPNGIAAHQIAICGPLVEISGAAKNCILTPSANSCVLGPNPGQITWTSSPYLARGEEYLAIADFPAVWTIPANALRSDRSKACIKFIQKLDVQVGGEANAKMTRDRVLKWCRAILDASRKHLELSTPDKEVAQQWLQYKQVARRLWRNLR